MKQHILLSALAFCLFIAFAGSAQAETLTTTSFTPTGIGKGFIRSDSTAWTLTTLYHVGRQGGSMPYWVYRSYQSVSAATLGLPGDAVIESAQMVLHFGSSQTYTTKVVTMASDPSLSGEATAWSAIGSGAPLVSEVTTSGTQYPNIQSLPLRLQALVDDSNAKLHLGFLSNNENDSTSSPTNISVEFTFTYQHRTFRYFVKNSYDAGPIIVDGIRVRSGVQYNWNIDQSHNLTAVDTMYETYNRTWHTTGTPASRSHWLKKLPTQPTAAEIPGAVNRDYSYYVLKADSGASIIAGLMKTCNISLRLQSDAGDVQDQGIIATRVEYDTVTITAPATMIVGGNTYPFANWSDGTTQRSHQFTENVHTTEVAIYESPYPSGTLPASTNWTGAKSLAGDVYVPTGLTLTIKASSTVNLNGHSVLSTGGVVTMETGATINGLHAYLRHPTWSVKGLFSAIQSAINAAADNDRVDIVSGIYTEDLSVNNKTNLTITGTQFYSILDGTLSVTDCPGLWLTDISCNKVIAYYCNGSYFYCDIAGLSNDVGYKIVCCADFQQGGLGYGYVYNCTTGLWAYNCTGDVLSSANFQDNLTSVLASDGANVYCHEAHFCASTTYDLKVQSGGYIGAYDCYYDNGTPRTLNFRGQGTIYTSGAYTCGLPKLLADASSTGTGIPAVATDPDASAETEFSAISLAYFTLTKDIREDIQTKGTLDRERFYGRLGEVTSGFKNFIKSHPHSPLAKAALSTAAQSFWRFEDYEAKKQFLADIIVDDSLAVLRPEAKRFMIDYYRDIKDYDRAIKAADDFIGDPANGTELISLAVFEKGMIFLNGLNQPEKASGCFAAIVNAYPESPIVDLAKNQLGILKGRETEQPPTENHAAPNAEYAVTNYPNPFNPSTTFTFVLPSPGVVSLVVYDVLGREVAFLAKGYHEAGSYSTTWKASTVASGVYYARLIVADASGGNLFTKVNKLLLMK